MKMFTNKTENLCSALARTIQREQERQNINNKDLAQGSGLTVRTICYVKAGGCVSCRTLDKILDFLGLELTAQPIGADYCEQMKDITEVK